MGLECFGIIYKVTNKINGKIYVGQTIKGLTYRKNRHINSAKKDNYYFHKALNKHGSENFNWEIIERCDSKEELDEMEFHYIKQHGSVAPGGYNCTLGGEGWCGHHSEETKAVLSKKSKDYFNAHGSCWKGRSHSEATKRLLSEKLKGKMVGVNNPFYGKIHSKTTRDKISESIMLSDKHVNRGKHLPKSWRDRISESNTGRKMNEDSRLKMIESKKKLNLVGKNNKDSKKFVIIFPTGEEFYVHGLRHFCNIFEEENLDVRLMSAVAMGKRNHHKGYKCRHYDEILDSSIMEFTSNSNIGEQ